MTGPPGTLASVAMFGALRPTDTEWPHRSKSVPKSNLEWLHHGQVGRCPRCSGLLRV